MVTTAEEGSSRTRPSVGLRRLGVVALVTLFLLGCSGGGGRLPPPSSTTSTVEVTTTIVDLTGVPLAGVDGTTTTSLAEKGTSAIRGSVVTPEGTVAGATVRLERLVLGAVQIRDVVTDEAGRYEATAIPGGAYRVRAFLPPLVAQIEPEVFRIAAGEVRDLDLRAEIFEDREVAAVASPAEPRVDAPVNVTVRVSERVVDDDGVVRDTPLPGLSVVIVGGRWAPIEQGGAEGVTDERGEVLFELECRQSGPAAITIRISDETDDRALDLPPCTNPPPETTTSTTAPGSTSSSSLPSSTTTEQGQPDGD